MALRERVSAALDTYLSRGADPDDPDTVAMTRRYAGFTLVCCTLANVVAVHSAVRGAWVTMVGDLIIGNVAPLARLLWLRRVIPSRAAYNVGISGVVIGLVVVSIKSGETFSPAIWFLMPVPFVAGNLGGIRMARAWAGVAVAAVVLVFLLGTFAPTPPEVDETSSKFLVNQLVLIAAGYGFFLSAFRATQRHIAELQDREETIRLQATDLEKARDAADAAKDWAVATAEDLAVAKQELEAANEAKTMFLANMSHEIRTPMNGVLGMAELLAGTRLEPQQRDFLSTIRSSGETLLTILNDVLDFSKIEAGKMTIESVDFPLRAAVEDAVALFGERAQSKGLELVCWVEPDVPEMLTGDPTRLRQVVSNLVSNAIKFTAKGEVVLHTAVLGASSDGSALLRFEVSDTGIGIAPAVQDRLFEAFTQADGSTARRFGGTGLGLSISRQLTELMGGRMGLESTEGHGSTFWFEIPFGQAEAVPIAEQAAEAEAAAVLRGRRVLVVDDSATSRTVLATQLRAWGLDVVVREDGLMALDHARQAPDSFDVVLVDLHMAGVDGITLTRHFSEARATAGAHKLLLATMCGTLDRSVLEEAGVHTPITKPVRVHQLRDALVKAVSGQDSTAADERVDDAPQVAELASALRGRRFLVADDNPVNRRIALAFLDKLGCVGVTAANGIEVLALFDETGQHFDAILMDCQMPLMDGYAASRQVRDREEARGQARTPIVALTAHLSVSEQQRCRQSGMDDCLSKPYTLVQLAQKLVEIEPVTVP